MGIITSLFAMASQNAAVGWALRRIPDWGGWIGGVVGGFLLWFSELDPESQMVIINALQGNWQTIMLGSLGGLGAWGVSQWRSWRATVNPHVVEPGKKRRELTETAPPRGRIGGPGPAPRQEKPRIYEGLTVNAWHLSNKTALPHCCHCRAPLRPQSDTMFGPIALAIPAEASCGQRATPPGVLVIGVRSGGTMRTGNPSICTRRKKEIQ